MSSEYFFISLFPILHTYMSHIRQNLKSPNLSMYINENEPEESYFKRKVTITNVSTTFHKLIKVRQNRNDFFKLTLPPKNEQMNSILLL